MRKELLFAAVSVGWLTAGANVGMFQAPQLSGLKEFPMEVSLRKAAPMKISERPEGESRLLTKASWGYQVYLEDYALDMVSNGSVVEMIEDAEGNVWFNNPTIGLVTSNWYKAEKDGDQLVVKGMQEIAVDPTNGRTLYLTACELYEDAWEIWYRPTENLEYRYDVVDGKIVSADPELVLGLCYKTGEESYRWAGYGDYDIVMTDHTGVALALPEGIATESWTLSDGQMGHEVKVGFDGDAVYVGGVLESLPDSYIKGSLAGDKITFASNQYLGIDTNYLCDAYFIGAVDKCFYNEYGEYVVWFDMLDDITFTYDAETSSMTCNDEAILVNAGTDYVNKIYSANHPVINKLSREVGAPPVAPEFTDIMWYVPDWGFGVFAYQVPNIDVNGYPLSTDRLYYEVFYNGDLVTFYPDECPGLEEPTERIPYDFYDNVGIYGDDTGLRTIIFYSYGVESIGLQSIYVEEDGTEVRSEMAEIYQENVGVSEVPALSAVRTEYYDLSGRQVSPDTKGVTIIRQLYEDGTVKVHKVIR
ncbi:MAG: hypothetical protein HDR88_16620 [Bacteroides sp.]|nr:hypothetical protein [Bacteroides sp.]